MKECLYSESGKCARTFGLLGLAEGLLRFFNQGQDGMTIERMIEILRGNEGKSNLRQYARDLDSLTNSSCANCPLRKNE